MFFSTQRLVRAGLVGGLIITGVRLFLEIAKLDEELRQVALRQCGSEVGTVILLDEHGQEVTP